MVGLVNNRFFKRQWAFFCSLKLTLAVLLLLALGLFVGMFWDQTLPLDAHLAKMDPQGIAYYLFRFLELNDVFHSFWFGFLVLLLACNLIACSIERLPPIWHEVRYPKKHLNATLWERLPNRFECTCKTADGPKIWLHNRLGMQFQDKDGFIQKHASGRFGVYVIHTALLMILFGSILTTQVGLDGMMMIEEGKSNAIVAAKGPGGLTYFHDLGFQVVCLDFRLKTFVDGSPMAFESDLAIIDPTAPNNPIIQKTVRVNEPLDYKGYRFYQSSYQPLESEEKMYIAVAPHGKNSTLYKRALGQAIVLQDGREIIPTFFVADFNGFGPAVQIKQIYQQQEETFFVFRQYPKYDPYIRRGLYDIYFRGVDQSFSTGISVSKTPFIPLVFLGFIVLGIGFLMAFLMRHRVYYANISENQHHYTLKIAAISKKQPYAFQKEFNHLIDELQRQDFIL